ncbi:hypothetical protein [Colwellia psychrerythraea]|uniref:Lipoprotein n=1 Tax=Colwellia psychrerythraea TaxID=28229 RepID=A0A099KY81_COLPS|nr:hypothetical protein [Colwellia psychrerythraea]KGJ94847.1 hypothetical protein GAB14E_2081 [Colwellia psychrerythraea]
MISSQYNRIFVLLFILTPLLCACGEEEDMVSQTQNVPSENSMTTNIEAQNLIELEATESLSSVTMEGSFDFEMQRMVTVNLHFLTTQFQEKISIYSTIDDSSNSPINLLEQGTINQGNSYKSMLTAATALSSLIVVRNDDFSKSVTITINSNDLLTHTFQE